MFVKLIYLQSCASTCMQLDKGKCRLMTLTRETTELGYRDKLRDEHITRTDSLDVFRILKPFCCRHGVYLFSQSHTIYDPTNADPIFIHSALSVILILHQSYHEAVQMVEALRYKSAVPRIDSRMSSEFFIDITLPAAL